MQRNYRPPAPLEESEQAALIEWSFYNQGKYPELRLLYHVPNGDWRHPATAAKLQRLGVKPGVPDLCLPVARGGFHGLYVEMKRLRGSTTIKEQKQWHQALKEQGYACFVCKGWDAARAVIESYLKLPKEKRGAKNE